MKKICILILNILIVLPVFSVDIKDLEQNNFVGLNINDSIVRVKGVYKNTESFNVAYSSILPAYGVYSIFDSATGKEALVQIGEARVYEDAFNIYLPENVYKFFASSYDKKINSVNLKIKYIGSNRKGDPNKITTILNMVVDSEDTPSQVIKNGTDTQYIQIGSFSHKYNAFPVISEMKPYLTMQPHFYIMRINVENAGQVKPFYRVLVGPYDLDLARKIVKKINKNKKKSVFIKSSKAILNEYTNEYAR